MKQRNFGLDICRIIAMLGIIVLHILDQGGVIRAVSGSNVNLWLLKWLFILSAPAVNVFAIMSGYFGFCQTGGGTKRAIELVLIMLVYSAAITIVFMCFAPSAIAGVKGCIYGFFPPLAGRYWYITCFVPILIFRPFINQMLLALTIKQHRIMVGVLIAVFSFIPAVVNVDMFAVNNGYSFFWLLCCYVKCYWQYIAFALAISMLGLAINIAIFILARSSHVYLSEYTSPVILAISILFVLFSKNLRVSCNTRFIRFVSNATFDIYIVHAHCLLYDHLLQGAFSWINNFPVWTIPTVVVLCAGAIFVCCAILSAIRMKIFRILRVELLLQKLSAWCDKKLMQNEW